MDVFHDPRIIRHSDGSMLSEDRETGIVTNVRDLQDVRRSREVAAEQTGCQRQKTCVE